MGIMRKDGGFDRRTSGGQTGVAVFFILGAFLILCFGLYLIWVFYLSEMLTVFSTWVSEIFTPLFEWFSSIWTWYYETFGIANLETLFSNIFCFWC